ncbi:MAG: lactate dehydrogenase [Gammaproteobacteria bacterium]|nr:lactate dehydrogenase [Gammaproteobacteria bacterium]
MDISIIGASGDVGRQVAIQLIAEQVIAPSQRLQLVGREEGKSAQSLFGLRADLLDAYAETSPEIDVALSPHEITADIIIMTAGATVPTDPGKALGRAELGKINKPLFESYAKAIADHGHGDEIVLIVSNPVELGVEVFSRYLGRERVIGIGAYQDSLRFRREIAADLGVRRQRVHAFVLGEHGENMYPMWNTVQVYGMDDDELATVVKRLSQGRNYDDFRIDLMAARQELVKLLNEGRAEEAFTLVYRLPPDLRTVLVPFMTYISGAKTSVATANVVSDLVDTIIDGKEVLVSGQVSLRGECFEMNTVMGMPIIVGQQGWTQIVTPRMSDNDFQYLKQVAEEISQRIDEWYQNG